MDEREHDPISQFFPDQESVDLYEVLNLSNTAAQDEIKKAYRRLALLYHPDKHTSASDEAKEAASLKFQQIGFAYAVLSDAKRKERYDKTGSTSEGFDLGPGDEGWEAYFEDLFERVTRGRLDEMKKEYQGSPEEIEDLKKAYLNTKGSIGEILTHIPHSTIDDEPRIIVEISKLIKQGDLPKMKEWQKSIKDEKARLVRQKESRKEAAEAEALAKDMGIWDEFYGDGKPRKRKGKGKEAEGVEEDETAALKALILRKKEKGAQGMASFFDNLEDKYVGMGGKSGKGKKRGHAEAEGANESSAKKARVEDIPDDEWAGIQARLFGDKPKTSKVPDAPPSKNKARKKKERKAST